MNKNYKPKRARVILSLTPDEYKALVRLAKQEGLKPATKVGQIVRLWLRESRGYGKDDISWCADDRMFVCDEHKEDKYTIAEEKGMEWCASYPCNDRFKHLFLYWETKEGGMEDEKNT